METHENIFAALAAARAEFTPIRRDSENPLYRSKYASLASIVDAITPALSRHGLSYTQRVSSHLEVDLTWSVVVTGTLYHASGSSIEFGEFSMPVVPIKGSRGDQPITHAMGSAITYARRYKIGGDLNLVTDDDDDAAGGQGGQQHARSTPPPPAKAAASAAPPPPAKPAQRTQSDMDAINGFSDRIAACVSIAELNVVAKEIGTCSQAVREGCRDMYAAAKRGLVEAEGGEA